MNLDLGQEQGKLEPSWEDSERLFCRGWREQGAGKRVPVLAVLPAAGQPTSASLGRLAHEFALRGALESTWAARPLALEGEGDQTVLLLEDEGGEPLEGLLDAPLAAGRFLPLAIGIVRAVAQVHLRDLVHKDLKPTNILVDPASGAVRLTGFGIASRLPR